MCIICVSPKGSPQPTTAQIKTMFENNPHGAGYMVARDGKVEIHKGFMELSDFLRQINAERFTPDDVVVYHFRISTQAGITPEMTHPFPLTSNITMCEKLDLTCSCGVAHNGIIQLTSGKSNKYSDTALFIAHYMVNLVRHKSDLRKQEVLTMLEHLTHSRLAIMDCTGYVATVGHFIKETNGLLFSNLTYKDVKIEWTGNSWKKFSL